SGGSEKDISNDNSKDRTESQDDAETNTSNNVKDGPYAKELEAMEAKFMDYINNDEIWVKVYEDSSVKVTKDGVSEPWIQVHQYKGRPMCYKVIAYMNNTAAVTFDALCELDRRMEWDPMCVEARVLENVTQPPGTTVQYIRTKAVWPTASRDTVALGTVKDLGTKGMFMVNASIEHPSMPERVKEGFVRMETVVAGHIIIPDGDGSRCKLTQIFDADLKGWIPDKVIQVVSTKAVPDGLRAINKLIPNVAPYTESKVLSKVAQSQKGTKSKKQDLKDMDPAEVELVADNMSGNLPGNSGKNVSDSNSRHTLRRQRSIEEDISLSNLSDRLKVVESEIENERQVRLRSKRLNSSLGNNDESSRGSGGNNAGALSKPKDSNIFSGFWESIKENVRHSFRGKANKILIAVIIVAVFGLNFAKLKKR
ncbi:START domain-containing protein 10, partial [Entomortierella beljakovae]